MDQVRPSGGPIFWPRTGRKPAAIEFVDPAASRAALLAYWEEEGSRLDAAHSTLIVGEIVMFAQHPDHDRWRSSTVPRNRSMEFQPEWPQGEPGSNSV